MHTQLDDTETQAGKHTSSYPETHYAQTQRIFYMFKNTYAQANTEFKNI